MGIDPSQIIMPGGSSRGKQFETHELRRVPVWLTREAHEVMHQASPQTRIFPQALAEAFGQLPEVERVYLEVHPHSSLFPLAPIQDRILATLTIQHGRYHDVLLHFDLACCYQYFMGQPVFQASLAANELVRLYDLSLKQRKPYRHPNKVEREEGSQEWVIMHP